MKRTIIAITALVLTAASVGCGRKAADNSPPQNDTVIWSDMLVRRYENGRIYRTKPVFYIDYGTMESTVLCSRPNCSHTSSDCIGNIVGDTPILTDNGIYFFNSVQGVNESGNSEREYYINSKLCRVSLESAEVETVAEFHDCAPGDYNGCLLYRNKLYFIGDNMNPTYDDYGNIISANIGGEHYLCSIDLDTAEYKNYGVVYDKTDEGAAVLCGMYNEKIIVNFEYLADEKDYDESKPWYGLTEVVMEFDPETEQFSPSDIPNRPVWLDTMNNTVVYYDTDKGKTVVIDNGEEKEIDIMVQSFASYFNNKLFVPIEGKWYDMADMSEHSLGEYAEDDYYAVDYVDGCYILGDYFTNVKLTEDELRALDN